MFSCRNGMQLYSAFSCRLSALACSLQLIAVFIDSMNVPPCPHNEGS
jgi:hypothetical protein